MSVSLMEGNEAIAHGALRAGCRFFSGYPITPATTILKYMLEMLPPEGGVCLQGEDEISSIGYCLGASMAGMKVMTATSGPGISLCSENISFAIGSEIPIVIVDVQRQGPSTGAATRGADGDINFLKWGNSGGLPVIVLAPVDAKDCYTLTIHAFNLAEKYRCPVFVASNKEIAMTRESVDIDSLESPKIFNRIAPDPKKPFLPFQVENSKKTPGFLEIGGKAIVRQTSSTHGANGYITTNPEEIAAGVNRLKDKVESAIDQFSFYETFGPDAPETLVVTYGVTARAAKAVISKMKDSSVGLLVLKTLWPVPVSLIRKKARHAKRILVVEMNLGQYKMEIERILPDKNIEFMGQMNGMLITPRQIMEALKNE